MSDDALKTAAAAPKQSRPDTVEWEHLDLRKYYFFGPLASFATRAMLYPANLVKTRLQVQHHTSFYNGTFDAFGKIIRHEGPRALFKGFGINCLGIIASQCYITSYEALRHHMRVVSDIEPVRNFVAGAAASFISQSIAVPIDIVSQRLMVQGQTVGGAVVHLDGNATALTTRRLIRHIAATEGMRGFLTGFWASLLSAVPMSAIWWTSYGAVRRVLLQARGGSAEPSILLDATAGAAAGAVTAITTNPLDIIRARLQVDSRAGDRATIISTLRQLVAEDGWSGLNKGMTARILHMAPSSIIMIISYEWVKRLSLRKDIDHTA
eukprot:m.9617 g.9617  ORF g.9617 m.9617 type:complete len:323 (-) comp2993_c0_seq2:151-1119(-)